MITIDHVSFDVAAAADTATITLPIEAEVNFTFVCEATVNV